jgi:hypothetical protein
MKHPHHQLEGARSRAGCEVVSSRTLVPRSTPMVYEDLLVPPVPIVTPVINEPSRCRPMESSSATVEVCKDGVGQRVEVRGMEPTTGGSRFHRAGRYSPFKCHCHCPSPPLSWIALPPFFVLLSALLPLSSPVLATLSPALPTLAFWHGYSLLLNPLPFPCSLRPLIFVVSHVWH